MSAMHSTGLAVTSTARQSELDLELASRLGDAQAALWLAPPGVYSPELVRACDDAGLAAALLVTHRPHTAYRKIARVWFREPAALDVAVQHLGADLQRSGIAALKWEDADGDLREHALRNGFVEMGAPVASGAGTRQRAGYVKWLREIPARPIPYYRQTTEYSCGPVALLMAQSAVTGEAITRSAELKLWRRASHQPGAGPIALAVHADIEVFRPEVFISTEDVILGEHLQQPWELEVRELFDGEDERAAGELGIPITYRLFSLDEVAAEIEADAAVLLLIDEVYFHDETGSHWILAHGHRDGMFVLNDPWIDAPNGDSWVDASNLPVGRDDLEKIAWWGDPAFRGLVVLRRTSHRGNDQE